jgi:hypothetical protein
MLEIGISALCLLFKQQAVVIQRAELDREFTQYFVEETAELN